jgi:hypothetical protein
MQFGLVLVCMAVQWLRRVAGLSPRRRGFGHMSVHTRFVVDSVALEQVLFRVGLLPVPTVTNIPSMFRAYFRLRVGLTRTDGRNQGTFPQAMLFRKSRSIG